MILPLHELACLRDLVPVFTEPTARRFLVLLAAAVLTRGRHTVAHLVRSVGTLAPGHRTSVSSRRPGGPRSGSPAPSPDSWSDASSRTGRFSWSATIPSKGTPDRTSTARPATATRSDPPTLTPPGSTDTAGSCWPCSFASPALPAPGPCPS
jgi:hypothetical protein